MTRFIFSTVAAAALTLSLAHVNGAEAAIVDATYQGATLLPTRADPFDPNNQWPALSYGVSIDESLLGGSVAGSTVTIKQYESGAGSNRTSNYSIEVSGGVSLSHSVSQSYAASDFGTIADYEAAGAQTGLMFHDYLQSVGITVDAAIFADDIIASHDISLSFGAAHQVNSYSISQSSEGGASQVGSQWLSDDTGDYAHWFWYGAFPSVDLPSLNRTNAYSTLPGTWNVVVQAPLPASALLLIGGLAALGGFRKVRARAA